MTLLIKHSNGLWGHSLENGDYIPVSIATLVRTVGHILTYTLWCFNMLHKHNKLLARYEAFEARVIAIVVSRDLGVRAIPNNVDSLWKQ